MQTANMTEVAPTSRYGTQDFFVDEWKKWCRLCARTEAQYINIISGHCEPTTTRFGDYSTGVDIALVIEEFLRVHIKEDEKLSQLVCTECYHIINSMLKFRKRVHKVQQMYADIQTEEYRCKLNWKALYEKYGLNENQSFLSNNATELPVEEVFVADLACAVDAASNALAIEVKSEKKTDEVPTEILLNDFEKTHESLDPIGDQDCNQDSSFADDTIETSEDEDSETKSQSMDSISEKKNIIRTRNPSEEYRNVTRNSSEEFIENCEYNYDCKKCGHKFQRIKNYVSHMKKIHREIICPQCSESFKTAMLLRHHMKVHPNDFACSHCDRKLESKARLARHIKCAHENDQPLICEVCGVTLRTKKQLKEHMLQHSDYCPYECKVCGASFKVKSRLKRHMQIHGDKYICPECGKQLSTRATLKSHLLVHSDKMAHKCDFCGRLFKRANTLKNHLIAHTDLRPYACDFCDKRFSTGPSCRFHKRTMHPKELAELEASGAKAYTKNIPTLHVLKAVSKRGENFKPLASKQTGFVHFDKEIKSKSESTNSEQNSNVPSAE